MQHTHFSHVSCTTYKTIRPELKTSDMGQGGAMAIEDAVSIANLLPRDTPVDDIPARLRLYELARRSRVEKVLEYTRMNGRDENDLTGPRMSRKHQYPCLDSSLRMNYAQSFYVLLTMTSRRYGSIHAHVLCA